MPAAYALRRARLVAIARRPAFRTEPLEPRRLLSSGDLDPAFGGDGTVVTDVIGHADAMAASVSVATPDGKLLVAGQVRHGAGTDFALARYHADGSLDRSFGDNGRVVTDVNNLSFDELTDADVLPDGRILVAGWTGGSPWQIYGSEFVVARYNADGSLDRTFGGDGIVIAEAGVATAVSAAPGGKVVVAGWTGFPGSGDMAVLRFNADGSPDGTFGGGDGIVTTNVYPESDDGEISASDDAAHDVYVHGDGRILVGGRARNDFVLIRYLPDGSLDPSFGRGRGPDYRPPDPAEEDPGDPGDPGDGFVTTRFADANAGIADFSIWRGRIVAAGTASFTYDGSVSDFAVARYDLATGTLDRTFSGDGKVTVDFAGGRDEASTVLVGGDGGVVVAGYATMPNTLEDFAMTRLDFRGRPVASFGAGGKVTTDFATPGGPTYDRAADATFTRDGRIILAGPVGGLPGGDFGASGTDFGLARYSAGGARDLAFGLGRTPFLASVANHGSDAVVQRDGKLVVAGRALLAGGLMDVVLTRYRRDGSLDPTFGGGDGIATLDLSPHRDGRSSDGVSSVALDRYGRILVTGGTDARAPGTDEFAARRWDVFVARFKADGSLDRSFGGGAGYVVTDLGSNDDYPAGIAVAPSGRIVVAGQTRPAGAQWNQIATLRYLPTGALDPTFGGDGVVLTDLPGPVGENAGGVAVQRDGKVVVAGVAWEQGTGQNFAVLRHAADGSLDPSFGGGDGWLTTDFGGWDAARAVTVQSDGLIVVAGEGQATHARRFSDFAVARYLADGSPDPSFGAGTGRALLARDTADNAWDIANDVHVQRDGKVVLLGTTVLFPHISPGGGDPGFADFAAVRFGADGSIDSGFGTGGIAVAHFGGSASAGGGGIDHAVGRLLIAGGLHAYQGQIRPTGSDEAVAALLL